jgi:hypothetical protein
VHDAGSEWWLRDLVRLYDQEFTIAVFQALAHNTSTRHFSLVSTCLDLKAQQALETVFSTNTSLTSIWIQFVTEAPEKKPIAIPRTLFQNRSLTKLRRSSAC